MADLKVLIVNPPVRLDDKPRHIPHGLAIIANIIRRKVGIEPVFLDINAHRYSIEEIEGILVQLDFEIVLVGGIASVYRSIIELSELIKKHKPYVKIIAGGYAAMPIPEILLRNSVVDIVCTGEGELTVTELLGRFQKKGLNTDISDIRGISYKEGAKIFKTPLRPLIDNLDRESAMPAYDLLPMEIYLANPVAGIGRDIDMITIRGCPFRCSFCYQPWGHRPRQHSVDFVIGAIKYLKKKYDIDFISFQDDEFMVDKKRVREFCEKRNSFFPDLLWSCTGRADIIAGNENLVKFMKDSGCTLISCGFESGSQRMLDRMYKMQSVEEMKKAVGILRKNELLVAASFIIGMPGEDQGSLQRTLDFCLENNLPLGSLMFATPYPGSEIFNFALKTARIDKDKIHEFMMRVGDARDFVINLTDDFSNEELIQKRQDMIMAARINYKSLYTLEEIAEKLYKLFGALAKKAKFDKEDLLHRAKHGAMNTF